MNRYEYLVLTRPVSGTDDEFNRWYDHQHLRDVLAVPGIISARRYRVLLSAQGGGSPPIWQYVAVYEMECDDPRATLAELKRRAGTDQMPISATLERPVTATFLLEKIADRHGGEADKLARAP